ncbi:uclease 1 [Phytophthora megakarya]|uniref:Uclease 1 n=1 Tax=Phytophthora megakarya TaxID=4795 RepID=A0A225W3H1_9STRA|nr:uclease 1 [Phytophthora megakarya]
MELEAKAFDQALGFFAAALALDATDVVVWFEMATTAVETGKLWLARRALEEGFKVDATYWPLVETLTQVLREIGDMDEYRNVAAYLRRNDPHCAVVKLLDENTKKRARPTDEKLLKRAEQKLQHLRNIADEGVKRRKVLQQVIDDELRRKMQTRSYEVQQPSWCALGKVLLEAFEENNRDEHADVVRTKVEIKIGFEEQEETGAKMETENTLKRESNDKEKLDVHQVLCQEENGHPSPTKRPKHKEVANISAALETSVSTGISDNDTQDSGVLANDLLELQPRRRKSRRNEERLREEYAAAMKKAREKDLAYRLGAFLPKLIGNDGSECTSESVLVEWLPPLNVEIVDDEFRISNAKNEILSKTSSFAFTTPTEGSASITELQSSKASAREHPTEAPQPHVECVTGKLITTFISECDAGTESSHGVVDWVRHFLNRCGDWSHLKLGSDDEDIYRVCSWLEKALNGELDVTKVTTPIQFNLINVGTHSLMQGSRFGGNGLTLGAQLFLLELHFDMLLLQPVRGKRRRKLRRLVEGQVAQAQKLLFEFGWLEDSDETVISPTGTEFLRLLWLIARMYERCGNPQVAQDYFVKCREKLLAIKDDSSNDDSADATLRVDLPNQKIDNEITLEILDEKVSGLRFSDVCSEARRLFEIEDHDCVISTLLGHFFPFKQAPRMTDFLNEFGVDEDDPSTRGDGNKKLFEMVLESFGHSSKYSAEDTALFLLTTLYYVIDFLDGLTVKDEPNMVDNSPDEVCANALAAMDFILTQLAQNNYELITRWDYRLVLRGLFVRCLKPSILLRFENPNDFLSIICTSLEIEKTSESSDEDTAHRMIGVDAMARLLYVIRSLSGDEFRNLFTLVPHPVKRKQLRRDRIRLVLVELIRFLNRSFCNDDKLALSVPLEKRSVLMSLCCALMKEEEDIVARSDGKIPKQLFGNGAILFVLLYESYSCPDSTALPTQLVELIHLLHERLGQHGICGLTYFSETGSSGDFRRTSCFLELCAVLLSKFVKQKASVRDEENSPRKVLQAEEEDDEEDEDEKKGEYRFQKEVCQCYRCLYDVQILPGCEDHKTGTTFASLQHAQQSCKHEDALRLTRFAVPILLATKPKTNGQKKERLKLLYAVRDALANSNFAALSAQPATVFPSLETYLAPKGILCEDTVLPFPFDSGQTTTKSADETCLGHLWYLMGANYILGRVKRRGNLGELIEMEQHVRERVEFLMNDVLYYHPDRIDSWVRLGRTMKELYHAATDAFAAVLGRKLRIQALQWYAMKALDHYQDARSIESTQGQSYPDILSFRNVVLGWNLFKRIEEWQGENTDGPKSGSKASTSKDYKEETKQNSVQDQSPQVQGPIEEFATVYIVQVIEFARRCFEMAARLAEEAAKKHTLKLQGKRDKPKDADEESDFDEELEALQNKIIECNEESGLLLYNVLQEFSLLKEVNLALFPREVYSSITQKTLVYFRRGLAVCELNEDAHEDHFRLQYMIGKTLKKRRWRWLELHQQNVNDPEALSTATEMGKCFSNAEVAREEGDREHALVHAFYSLQALRIDLTISESPSILALRLAGNHFYEEDEDEREDAEADEDESAASTPSAKESKDSQEEDDPTSSKGTAKNIISNIGSKVTEPKDIKNTATTRKDAILALLSDAESNEATCELNVTLARGWIALNIIEALESIPDEDRYFHPSRYVLARIVYWLSTCYAALEKCGMKSDKINALLDAVRARRNKVKIEGPSDAAAWALKEMAPIFDKRRPQIVAIWFSEYIPTAKKFEELNQRQMKYDYYRLKYWRFYIMLLQENGAYARLKEVGSWVVACKEDHDVIDIMLGILPGDDRAVDALFKQLAKAYTYYLEVLNAQQRLKHVMDDCVLLLENAELPMVAVFFIGMIKYPSQVQLLEKDTVILDRDYCANILVISNALRRDELPPRIYDAQNREAWKAYLDAARSFCEEKWPERSGKGKPSKKHSRSKTAATTASNTSTAPTSTDAVHPTATGSS